MEKKLIFNAIITSAVLNTCFLTCAFASSSQWVGNDNALLLAPNSDSQGTPRLVINITIDQLRSDYLEAFAPLYSEGGFKKLFSQGRVYSSATYPSSRLDRASSAAVISTGSAPYNNGIIGTNWFDRETLRSIAAIEDSQYDGVMTADKVSPQRLYVTTIGDELKIATSGKGLVYSIAPWADEAVLQAGHAADGAYWIDNANGYWCSSSFYSKELPGFIRSLNSTPLSEKLKRFAWKPSNEMVGNFNYFLSGRLSKPFSHKFEGIGRYKKYKNAGIINDDIATAVVSCIKNSNLGSDDIPDYLSVTLSGGNFENRLPSEAPIELQDTYVRLDKAVSDILATAEQKVGKAKLFVVVTSSGYSLSNSEIPAQFKIPSGTFDITRTSSLLNMYLSAIWGQGKYVDAASRTDIYLDHKLLEEKQIDVPNLLEKSISFLLSISGVKDVYSATQLQQEANLYGINKIRNSYKPKCSGDLIIELQPGWSLLSDVTEEKYYTSEAHINFPVFLYGFKLTPDKVTTPIDVACIAPTVAAVMRIRAPNACNMPPLEDVK